MKERLFAILLVLPFGLLLFTNIQANRNGDWLIGLAAMFFALSLAGTAASLWVEGGRQKVVIRRDRGHPGRTRRPHA